MHKNSKKPKSRSNIKDVQFFCNQNYKTMLRCTNESLNIWKAAHICDLGHFYIYS